MDNETINIGKYTGMTVREVIERDISYIGWILNNNEIFAEEEGIGLSRVKYLITQKLRE